MAGEVGIKIKVSAKNAERNLNKLKISSNKLDEAFNKVNRRSHKTQTSLRGAGKAAKSASAGFNTLNKSLLPLLKVLAAVAATRFVIFQTAELETQTKALTVLTGSAEKAQDIVKEIKEFGAVTPFKSSQLINVAKRMKAFGFETEKVVDITKRVADIAGTAGADIDNVALAIGKVQAKNKFMQEENVMLLEKGINVTKELERIMGMNGEALAKAMSKGEVGADKFVQAVVNLTSKGGEFFGGANAQSDTLAGKFSTLIDRIETLAQLIGNELKPALKNTLDIAIKALNAIEKIFGRFKNIGAIGVGSVAKAEMDARTQATRLTKLKFGEDIRLTGFAFTDEEIAAKKFLKEQTALLTEQFIEREKLRNKSFEEVQINDKITEGTKDNLTVTKDTNTELNKSLNTYNQLDIANTQLNKTLEKQKQTQQEITNILASGMTNAVMGLIEGTKTLSQALADIAKQLASMFLQKGFMGMFSKMFSGGGDFSFGGGTDAFPNAFDSTFDLSPTLGFGDYAKGGYVNRPTMGLVGEGGESEYIIPASKMSGAMSKYSAGARGSAVISGGSGGSGTVAGGSGNTIVEYTGPVLNFNGDEYVPKSAVPEIINTAAKQGATAGRSQAFATLKNSRSQRATLGL